MIFDMLLPFFKNGGSKEFKLFLNHIVANMHRCTYNGVKKTIESICLFQLHYLFSTAVALVVVKI